MEHLTKINDTYYDLNFFNHPGGNTAIQHAYGRDATGLFVMHHPFVSKEKLRSILKKYEVPDPTKDVIESNPVTRISSDQHGFVYDTDFSRDLISTVKQYFHSLTTKKSLSQITKSTYTKWIIIFGLIIFNFVNMYLWLYGYLISLLLFPVSSWLLAVHTFHDACHFSLSHRPIINNLFSVFGFYFVSPEAWFYEHNIGHHTKTNILSEDPDLHHGEYLSRMHKDIEFKYKYMIQGLTHFLFVWPLSFFGIAIRPTISRITSGKYYESITNMKFCLRELLLNLSFF